MTRYLRQLGTNKAPFIWTERRAKRKDMVEYDPDAAKTIIEAKKRRLAELEAQPAVVDTKDTEKLVGDALEIAELDAKIKEVEDRKAGLDTTPKKPEKSEEELDTEERQVIINKNSEVVKIKAMRTKKDLCDYAEENFGKKLDPKENMESIRKVVIDLQAERIFEVR
jgi:hypothetical protein